jgi:orotidine-5'-phosphate decarboxylase
MKPLIVALDVDTEKEALSLIKATKAHVDLYKVGP